MAYTPNLTVTPAPPPVKLQPVSTADLMRMASREYILLAGKDGVGKSSAIVSLARFVQLVLAPSATFYVVDTENKFPTALRSFGAEVPTNIVYYKIETMNQLVEVMDHIMTTRKPGDWLAAESMGRIWERAQDMGYMAVSGFDKSAYLEIRRKKALAGEGKAAVIPSVDQFWNVVKGAHDGGFMDLMSQASSLNVILSTTIAKPPKDETKPGGFKENATRKEQRVMYGLDAGLDGAPRLPTYVETTLMLEATNDGKVECRVLRDNLSTNADPRNMPPFEIADKTCWAMTFWSMCR